MQNGEAQMEALDESETFESFSIKLRKHYGEDVVVTYEDEERDIIRVINTATVQHIVQLARRKSSEIFRLTVTSNVAPSPAASISSSSSQPPNFSHSHTQPPSSSFPSSSAPYGSGPLPSYSHPPPSFPPPNSLTPLPVEQRTFQTSHFKRCYAAAHVPQFQHKVFADLYAIIEWDCVRRNIDVNGEGAAFFQVFLFCHESFWFLLKR